MKWNISLLVYKIVQFIKLIIFFYSPYHFIKLNDQINDSLPTKKCFKVLLFILFNNKGFIILMWMFMCIMCILNFTCVVFILILFYFFINFDNSISYLNYFWPPNLKKYYTGFTRHLIRVIVYVHLKNILTSSSIFGMIIWNTHILYSLVYICSLFEQWNIKIKYRYPATVIQLIILWSTWY